MYEAFKLIGNNIIDDQRFKDFQTKHMKAYKLESDRFISIRIKRDHKTQRHI